MILSDLIVDVFILGIWEDSESETEEIQLVRETKWSRTNKGGQRSDIFSIGSQLLYRGMDTQASKETYRLAVGWTITFHKHHARLLHMSP